MFPLSSATPEAPKSSPQKEDRSQTEKPIASALEALASSPRIGKSSISSHVVKLNSPSSSGIALEILLGKEVPSSPQSLLESTSSIVALHFPEDRYLAALQNARPDLEHVEELQKMMAQAIHAEEYTSALMLCEKACDIYIAHNQSQEVGLLRSLAAELILKIPNHPLQDMNSSIASRDQNVAGTYISHRDTIGLKFDALHGEKRRVRLSDGTERDCIHFDFHLREIERDRLAKNMGLSEKNKPGEIQEKQEQLRTLNERLEKLSNDICDLSPGSLDAEKCTKEMEDIPEKIGRLTKEIRHVEDVLLHTGLEQKLTTYATSFPPFLRPISCTFDPTHYPIYENGVYTDRGFTLTDHSQQPLRDLVITFSKIGTVRIGYDPHNALAYETVSVELLDPSNPDNLQHMHAMLSLLGMGTVLADATPSDRARIKIFHLVQAYYPRLASIVQHSRADCEMPISTLISTIVRLQPDMEDIFEKYLVSQNELLTEEEVYSNLFITKIQDMGTQIREQHGVGLVCQITGGSSPEQQADNVCAILTTGFLSSEDRFQRGIIVKGASPREDFASGGADCVFARLVTNEFLHNTDKNMEMVQTGSSFHILFDVDVMGFCGTYGYLGDKYGGRYGADRDEYEKRLNLVELTTQIAKSKQCDNEVMVRHCIPGKYICGVVVQTENDKKMLIDTMRQSNVLVMKQGLEYVLEKPIDEFIHVAESFSKEMWSRR